VDKNLKLYISWWMWILYVGEIALLIIKFRFKHYKPACGCY